MTKQFREGQLCKWTGPDQRTGKVREHTVSVAYDQSDDTVVVQDEVGYMIAVLPDELYPLDSNALETAK